MPVSTDARSCCPPLLQGQLLQARVLELPPFFIFHHANSYEEGGRVVIDSIHYDSLPAVGREALAEQQASEEFRLARWLCHSPCMLALSASLFVNPPRSVPACTPRHVRAILCQARLRSPWQANHSARPTVLRSADRSRRGLPQSAAPGGS